MSEESVPSPKAQRSFSDLLGAILGGGTILIAFLALVVLGKMINSFNKPVTPDTIETPSIETPIDATGSHIALKTVSLLNSAYSVPKNVFDTVVYSNLFPRIVLNGSFEQAILSVKGKVGGSDTFLVFNFGNQGGVVRAVREAPTRLNIPQTVERGGLFPSGSTIDISINLLKETMGTTGSEFTKTNEGEREFNFIKGDEPVDVVPVAIIPFTNDGEYGGVTIGNLTISYSCKTGSDCKITKCDNNKKYTQCIKDSYGEPAMQQWCDSHNTCKN